MFKHVYIPAVVIEMIRNFCISMAIFFISGFDLRRQN